MTPASRWLTITGLVGLAISSVALVLWRHSTPTTHSSDNRALSLGWGSFATTTLDASPLNADHALSVRFMAAYDASYRGVIIADESGSYHLGMAPYASVGRPALEVCVGGATFTYPLPDAVLTDNDFRAGPPCQAHRRWRHLMLGRRGATIAVTYDGQLVGSFEAGPQEATGKLRLGRLARPAFGGQDQFYGLIDDIVVVSPELAGAVPTRSRLDFDAPSAADAAAFALGGSARLAVVSREHDAAADESRLPAPQHRTRLELPFLPGQVWMPIQGINSALSHHDVAAFALDFIRVDQRFVADNPHRVPGGSHDASQGQPVLAPARGHVAALVDSHGDDERSAANFACVQHEAHEVSCLLHLQPGAETREAARVSSGDVLARVGTTGATTVHLHFALSDLPESKTPNVESPLVTIPAAFSDYFASTDFGRSWHHVDRGIPSPGEWVRRSASPSQ